MSEGQGEFQKILDNIYHHFQVKNGNFKTRDFSPFIERVLAGVDI